MDELWYLFAAYTVVWVGLLGYLLFLASSITSLRKEVETLRNVLTDHEGA